MIYSRHSNTGQVRFSNVPNVSGSQMVRFSNGPFENRTILSGFRRAFENRTKMSGFRMVRLDILDITFLDILDITFLDIRTFIKKKKTVGPLLF